MTVDLIRSAIACIPPDIDRETWVRVAMAVKSELGSAGFEVWDEWSQQGASYNASDARSAWRSVKAGGGVTVATVFSIAKQHGFQFPDADDSPNGKSAEIDGVRLTEERKRRQESEEASDQARAQRAAREAQEIWSRAAESGHSPYLARKGVQGHGVRYLSDGTLLVPLRDSTGGLHNLQSIAPEKPTAEQQKLGATEKRFLAGGRKSGLWHLIGAVQAPAQAPWPTVLLAEGYATAASIHEATGLPVVVAFDAGNLVHVASALRRLFPNAPILVCGDDDRDTEARTGTNAGRQKAERAAQEATTRGAPAGIVLPEGLPLGASDFNDLASHAGATVVRAQIERAVAALSSTKHLTGAAASEARSEPVACAQSRRDQRDAHSAPMRDPFKLARDGVYFVARDSDGNEKPPTWLCASLRVTARTRAEDANGWGSLLEFHDLDGNAKAWAMPSSLLSGDGSEWAARLRDMGLPMAPGTRARNLVAQYIDTRNPAERVTCTDRVGWHAGGIYVLPSQCIGPTEERRYVFQSESGMEDTFRQHGALADWQQHVAVPCAGNSRLIFGISCAFAGPLLRLAGMESGGFHFRGDSSKGKTTALKISASVWGRPTYMQRWRTTDNALEATAVQHCDGLLILDEIGQVDGRVVGDCAYLLANEQEKGRATRNGLVRKRRTWRLLFLSSGEKSMADHMAEAGKRVMAGQEVRLIDIPLDAGAGMGGLECLNGYDSPGGLAEAITSSAARYYGTAGRAWLEWLAGRYASVSERTGPLLDQQRALIVPDAASEQVRRAGARFALVAVAGELAIEAGIVPWSPGQGAEAARACFNAWLSARGHMDNGEEAAMLRQVRAFLEKNGDALFTWTHRAMDDHRGNTPLRAGFKRMVDAEGSPIKIDAATDYVEKRSGELRERTDALVEYLVFPEAFRREVAKGFDVQAVADLLRKRGHLKHETGRLTIRQRLPGTDKAPVYLVKPSIFSDEM
ncbi:DUF927 domain-containing protein [Ideonella sp. YS5]|uniref:DUF927 domain-containing protein n=1 Tax=Ideonella sp. YS5 TaxID=3453714 RepID=UPI003EE96DC6